jgi:hypothetical protein
VSGPERDDPFALLRGVECRFADDLPVPTGADDGLKRWLLANLDAWRAAMSRVQDIPNREETP